MLQNLRKYRSIYMNMVLLKYINCRILSIGLSREVALTNIRGLALTAEIHVAPSGGQNLQQIIEQNPGTFTMQNRQSLTWLPLEII